MFSSIQCISGRFGVFRAGFLGDIPGGVDTAAGPLFTVQSIYMRIALHLGTLLEPVLTNDMSSLIASGAGSH